jgi:short-subunit dehydrogenase
MAEKVVVITGASAGIGAALAERLGRDGARLVLVARRQTELDAVVARSGSAIGIVADMTRREEVARVVREAIARFGHIDVWVNNVGRGISRPPSELTRTSTR